METAATANRITKVDIKLKFEDAIKDSPPFRAALQRNEDELDELTLILDALVRISRSCLEHAASNKVSFIRTINGETEIYFLYRTCRGIGKAWSKH